MMAMTADGKVVPYETPRALETGEVEGIVEAFRAGRRQCIEGRVRRCRNSWRQRLFARAFLQSRSNFRTDRYGGSIENARGC